MEGREIGRAQGARPVDSESWDDRQWKQGFGVMWLWLMMIDDGRVKAWGVLFIGLERLDELGRHQRH